MKKLALALLVAAVVAPAAAGGGFATVGLSSLPPDGLQAGQTWPVDVTVLQHGRTPVEGVQPIVRLRGPGGEIEEFAATPTKKPGVYHAVVTFPSNGTWSYEVWDDFSQTHTFEPVTIGAQTAPVAAPSPRQETSAASEFPTTWVVAIALGLLLVVAAVSMLLLRRSRRAPEPAEVVDLKKAA